ncbi:DUF4865 family protein [Bacillus sp. BRMEA1]|uniref:DUF4865 family protein n=1 Tax=Neobacillus endophyticus TaxID=2738405 RepID=UPI001564BB93|nr:DUF4865 family protein [Neobacillus endophyticus]NRD77752.1 DUF4865 family protein [Neobacillus endophyticus]
MIGMQYKVILPKDYDMEIIRKRVQENGHKTDGFPDLLFKAYLMTEEEKNGNIYNSYAPLYVWNHSQGMNHFIFDGFYDNILDSFGWQHIQIGVSYSINLDKNFHKSHYVIEYAGDIAASKSLRKVPFHSVHDFMEDDEKCLGDLLVYNPDKWRYSHFRFYQDLPAIHLPDHLTIYEILHISQ